MILKTILSLGAAFLLAGSVFSQEGTGMYSTSDAHRLNQPEDFSSTTEPKTATRITDEVPSAGSGLTTQSIVAAFQVTAPNLSGEWVAGNTGTVSWNVAGTNTSPHNCAHVNIWFSIDGGVNFDVPLALNTPNDGTQNFRIPNTPTSIGRVRVEGVENASIFDVNNGNILLRAAAGVVATPVISPGTRSFSTAVNVVLSCATSGAAIYYTTNGNIPVPGTSFTRVYGGPFGVFASTTIRAIGIRQGFVNSSVAVSYLTLDNVVEPVATPVISPATGTYATGQNVTLSCPTAGAAIYYTTNGNVPVIGTTFTRLYTGPFFMPGTGAVRAIALKNGMANSRVAVSFLTIVTPTQVATPVITPGTGSFTGPTLVSIQTSTSGATVYFTLTGNEPIPGTSFTRVYTGPFQVSSNTTVRAMAVKSGMVQSITSVAYLTVRNTTTAATPVISPGTGTFTGPQNVTIQCATPGVTLYYTTSGNIPVIGMGHTKVYTGPFQVSGNTTIRAMAVKSGLSNSPVAVSYLTISNPAGRQAVETAAAPSQLELFPNPTAGKVQVRWNASLEEPISILVFNTLGSEIRKTEAAAGLQEYSLDLSDLKSGIYFIRTSHHPRLIRVVRQ